MSSTVTIATESGLVTVDARIVVLTIGPHRVRFALTEHGGAPVITDIRSGWRVASYGVELCRYISRVNQPLSVMRHKTAAQAALDKLVDRVGGARILQKLAEAPALAPELALAQVS